MERLCVVGKKLYQIPKEASERFLLIKRTRQWVERYSLKSFEKLKLLIQNREH